MAVAVFMDGVDVTANTLEGSATHQHNRPSFATVRQPSHLATGTTTSRLKIVLDGTLDFHGSCVMIEDQGDEDTMYSTFTFADPTLIFEMRPARDPDGDFSKPSFFQAQITAPQIVEEIITNSISNSGAVGQREGPMGIVLGSFATGGASLVGAPADWPMSIAQVVALLAETGELDVVNRPIDDGTNMGEVSAYNGDYGSVTGTSFEYATGSFNAIGCRRTQDVRELCNKLWVYLGPREGTKADPAGDQHWAANITGDDSGLPDPPQATILAARDASRAAYYQRMVIRIFDGDGAIAMRELYRRWWQMESWMRLKPQTMVHITPQRGIKPSFRTGDLINVAAGTKFRGGFSGQQRVMEYTYRFDNDGVVELGSPVGNPRVPAVHVTADAEGI